MQGSDQKAPAHSIELEVIACTLEDALAAYRGGASRLEVTIRLDQAGLTPPVELVRQIIESTPLPVRVMLRDRPDFSAGSSDEIELLKQKAHEFAGMNIDGLVTGFVRSGGFDFEALACITGITPSTKITAHHAVEATQNPAETLRMLREYPGVDRALVSGGRGTLAERIERLSQYREVFGEKRSLIVGGHLALEMLPPVRKATGIRIFHLGRAVRTPEKPDGCVDSNKVRRAVELVTQD